MWGCFDSLFFRLLQVIRVWLKDVEIWSSGCFFQSSSTGQSLLQLRLQVCLILRWWCYLVWVQFFCEVLAALSMICWTVILMERWGSELAPRSSWWSWLAISVFFHISCYSISTHVCKTPITTTRNLQKCCKIKLLSSTMILDIQEALWCMFVT